MRRSIAWTFSLPSPGLAVLRLLLLSLCVRAAVAVSDDRWPQERRIDVMRECFRASTTRANKRTKEVQQMVSSAMLIGDMGQEDAVNAIILAWMVTCYKSMDEARLQRLRAADKLTNEIEDDVFESRKYKKPLGKSFEEHLALLLSEPEERTQLAKSVMKMPADGQSASAAGSAGAKGKSSNWLMDGIVSVAMLLSVVGLIAAGIFVSQRFGESSRASKTKDKKEKKRR